MRRIAKNRFEPPTISRNFWVRCLKFPVRFPLSVKTQVNKKRHVDGKKSAGFSLAFELPESIPTKKAGNTAIYRITCLIGDCKNLHAKSCTQFPYIPTFQATLLYTPNTPEIQKAAISGLIDEIIVHPTAALEIQCSFSNNSATGNRTPV